MEKEKQIEILKELKKELEEINNNPRLEMSERLQERKALIEREIELRCCNHIFVIGQRDEFYDGHKNDRYEYHYCIKCGLNEHDKECQVLGWDNSYYEMTEDVYKQTCTAEQKHDDIYCPSHLIPYIVKDIKKRYPKISDKKLLELFRKEIINITDNKKIKKADSDKVIEYKKRFMNNKFGY